MTHAIVEPSPERRQHNRVHRVVLQDVVGDRSIPWQADGLLAQLERRGEIDDRMRNAAEMFHAWFQRAHLEPLRAADMARTGHADATHNGNGSEVARRQVRNVLDALGGRTSLAGSILWDVVGEERSIRYWSLQHGRDQRVAKGILIASLDRLATLWGLT